MAQSKIVRCLALVMFMALGSTAKADGLALGGLFSGEDMDLGVFLQFGDLGGNGNNGGGHHHGDGDGYPDYPEYDEDYGGGYNEFELTQQDSDAAVASCGKRNRYVFSIEKNGGVYELPGARKKDLIRVNIGQLGISVICTRLPRQGEGHGQPDIDFGGPAILPAYPADDGFDNQDQFFGDNFQPGPAPQITQPWPNQPLVNPGYHSGTTNGAPNVLPPVDPNFGFDVQALQ